MVFFHILERLDALVSPIEVILEFPELLLSVDMPLTLLTHQ